MPTMSIRPSGKSSATTAATLEVPMSSAMMRFLLSRAMSDSRVGRLGGFGRRFVRHAERKSVGVAQVDVLEAFPRLAELLREHRHEPREALLDAVLVGVAPELNRDAVRELDLPGEAWTQQHLERL